MKKLLIIALLFWGCDMFEKNYKCELTCENNDGYEANDEYAGVWSGCAYQELQVEALDIDEAEEYFEDWFEVDSINNTPYPNTDIIVIYSCNCEVFP